MKENIIFLLMYLLLSTLANAQTTLKGRVLDITKQPLPYSNVLLLQKQDSSLVKGQVANSEGFFEIRNIQEGNYLLSIKMIGYQALFANVEIIKYKSVVELNPFELEEDNVVLNEVNVTAQKPFYEQQADRMVVNVQNSPTSSGSSALDVLERSPNVQVDRINSTLALNGREGTMVMINGKISRMDANALMLFLEGMPANNIKKIELIHTPPSSYDAAGSGGLINIELVKNEDDGINGFFSANIGYGLGLRYGSTFNLNVKKNKFNFYANLSTNKNYMREDTEISSKFTVNDKVTYSYLYSDRPASTVLDNARVGVDYQMSKKTTIGVLFSTYSSLWELDATSRTKFVNAVKDTTLSNLSSKETNHWTHWMGNFNVIHQFSEKSKLTFDFDYLSYYDNNPTDYQNNTLNDNQEIIEQTTFISRKKTPIHFEVVKLDYSKTIRDGLTLNTGVKGTYSQFTNNIEVSNFEQGTWVKDEVFTNIFKLKEEIQAAYTSLDYQVNTKIFLKAGLRYEHTKSHLNSLENADLLNLNYGRFFPTVSLSYRFKDEKQWQISYNERIFRPSFNMIAPALFFFGTNNILSGNASLRPMITRQLSTSFQYKTLNLSLSLSQDIRSIVFQPVFDETENRTIWRAENMKESKNIMFSVNYSKEIKWWNSRYTVSFFAQEYYPIYEGKPILENTNFFTFNTSQNFKLPHNLNIELSNFTMTSRKWGVGRVPLRTFFNFGIQKSFKESHKLSFNWNDILDIGSFWKVSINKPELGVEYTSFYDMAGSFAKITYTYNFGSNKVKKARNRNIASEEENSRVN
jgi:hypothetical protein